MKPGPLPKPTALKVLQGTLRKDRQNPREPKTQALTRAPKPPDWLDDLGRAAWGRLCKVLLPTRVLVEVDGELLALFAHQLGTYERCARALADKDGLTFVVTDSDGNAKSIAQWPEIKIGQAAVAECRRLAEHFGMSPASRSRVSAVTAPDVVDDEWARFDMPS